jgi:polyhydroxyalkanoate synthesis regulator phasin
MAEDEIDNMVKGLVNSKEISKSEGNRLKTEIIGYTTSIKAWISDTIDKRLKEVLAISNLATKSQLSELNERIRVLEKRIEDIQAKETQGSK